MPVRESECTVCPPWVLRCGHFEEQTLYLCDVKTHLHNHSVKVLRYAVTLGELVDCNCGRGDNILVTDEEGPGRYKNLAEAQAEFTRREAALLRREA